METINFQNIGNTKQFLGRIQWGRFIRNNDGYNVRYNRWNVNIHPNKSIDYQYNKKEKNRYHNNINDMINNSQQSVRRNINNFNKNMNNNQDNNNYHNQSKHLL